MYRIRQYYLTLNSICFLLLFSIFISNTILDAAGDNSCSCPSYPGCSVSDGRVPGGPRENIALGKKADITSLWNKDHDPSAKACAAINGNTSRHYGLDSSEHPNCVYTKQNEHNQEWSVDLGRNYTITDITVYTYAGSEVRMENVTIYIDKEECYKHLNTDDVVNIKCSKPLTGQFVKLYSDGELAFCEVQIWVCRIYIFGKFCNETCHCKDNVTCDNYFGTCPSGCAKGFYGSNCSLKCGNCQENTTCDIFGTCYAGCRKGWQPPFCIRECDAGSYGPNCSNKCGYCMGGNSSCDPVSGHCQSGCQIGWLSLTCDTELMENDSEGIPIGGIVGGVVGAFAIVVVVVVIVILLRYHRRRTLSNRDKLNSTNSEVARKKSTRVQDKKRSKNNVWCAHAEIERFKPPVPVKPHHPSLSGPECTEQANDDSSTYNIIEEELNTNDNTHHEYRNVLASIESVTPLSTTRVSIYPSKSNHENERDAFNHKEQYVYARVELKHKKSEISDAPSVRSKPLVPKKPEGVRISGANTIEIKQLEENDNDEYEDDTKDVYNNEDIYSTYKLQKQAPVFDALQQSLLDSLSSNTLSTQFKELKKDMKYPNSSGQIPANAKKNRFKVLCPYDYNRVILERYEGDSETDYINASYIKGYKRDNAYIAAQGPRRHTVNDMWFMIWQENITHVIMLTNLKEDGKDKCEKYWPGNGRTQKYGHVIVSGINVEMRDDYIIRMFSLQVNGNTLQKHVEQYHYLAWPDHGVPRAMSLVNYWRYVRDRASKKVPLLVHCSAGVGRTGTYIALDIAMDMSAHTLDINVQKIVLSLREERHLMVQAEAQYKFLFEVILEAYTSRSTRLTSDQFNVKFHKTIDIQETSSVIDKEFEMLQQIGKFVPKPTFSMASAEENIFKNRNPDALPEDSQLAYVGVPVNGRNLYINAVFLSSFKRQRNILLTQLPLPDTLVDIWRLVDDKDVNLIVSLSSKHEDDSVENYCQYWPRAKGGEISTGPYTVKLTGSRDLGHNTTSYHLTYMRETKNKQCRVLHYTNWSGEVPDNTEEIIHLVETINVARSENDSCSVLIQCIDGAAKSGLFCIIWENLIRLKNDHENDIYLTARKVRIVRPQAVNSQVQYRFCYKVAQDYQHNAGVYQNT